MATAELTTTFCLEYTVFGFCNHHFFTVWVISPKPTPNLEDQECLFIWLLPFDLSGMGGPVGSFETPASIALGVIEARKPPHRVKVATTGAGSL